MLGFTLSRIRLEEHAFFIVFIAMILIVFWYCIWELLQELTDHINDRHNIEKWKIYMAWLLVVFLLIGIFPQILEKL
jgi:uncharacterized membrane protein YidH (DUF202 family)